MKISVIDSLKILAILILFSGVVAASAFTGPTNYPVSGNTPAPFNTSTTPQSKGGNTVPAGSLFDVGQTFSANILYVLQNMTVQNQVKVSALTTNQGTWTTGLRPVCIDTANKLIICAPQCGNSYVEKNEQCDDGNIQNGDGCSNSCQIE